MTVETNSTPSTESTKLLRTEISEVRCLLWIVDFCGFLLLRCGFTTASYKDSTRTSVSEKQVTRTHTATTATEANFGCDFIRHKHNIII